MNNLDTTQLGRMPIVLDDLRFINDSIKEVLNGIVAHDNSTVVILSGCIVDYAALAGGTLNMTAGSVFWNNEIFKVPAVSGMAYDLTVRWELVEVNDPAGLKTFANSTTHQTYKLRTVEVKRGGTPPSGSVLFALTKNIFDLYRLGMAAQTNVNKIDPFQSLNSPSFDQTTDSPLRAWLNVDGSVSFKGELKSTLGGYGVGSVGQLSTAFIPGQASRITYDLYNSSSDPLARGFMSISATGAVTTTNTIPVVSPPPGAILKFNETYNL